MSEDEIPPLMPGPPPVPPSGGPPPLPPRNGCLAVFMILVGIVLLLPGLCALLFGATSISYNHFDSGIAPFVVLGLIVGVFGVVLIVSAIRGLRR